MILFNLLAFLCRTGVAERPVRAKTNKNRFCQLFEDESMASDDEPRNCCLVCSANASSLFITKKQKKRNHAPRNEAQSRKHTPFLSDMENPVFSRCQTSSTFLLIFANILNASLINSWLRLHWFTSVDMCTCDLFVVINNNKVLMELANWGNPMFSFKLKRHVDADYWTR